MPEYFPHRPKACKSNTAFTLIEILIVVLIIGILMAIALPNFFRARENAHARACVGNLRQIDSAKEHWAMDYRASAGATAPPLTDLSGTGTYGYIKELPQCPEGGTYSVGVVAGNPTCTVGGTGIYAHTL